MGQSRSWVTEEDVLFVVLHLDRDYSLYDHGG